MHNNADKSTGSRFPLRPFMFGITLGLGIGLATKNLAVGLAVGLVLAMVFGASDRPAK